MVIILGLDINGLTVCRALGKLGLELVGVSDNYDNIGTKSKYLKKVYYKALTEDILLSFLLAEFQCEENIKPLLFPTSDRLVDIVAKNYSKLSGKYHIGFQHPEIILSLLDKDTFRVLADMHGLRVSRGDVFQKSLHVAVEEKVKTMEFPVILKTCKKYYPSKKEEALPKALIFSEEKALVEAVTHFLSKADKVVVEEFVDGDDSDVYFVFVYSNNHGKVVKTFSGQKLRQWPVGTGGTASARHFDSQVLVDKTIKFFEEVGFTGLGSMEYKLNKKRNEYIAIEPTVGRIDFQEGLAIGNGVNFPALLYYETFSMVNQHLAIRNKNKREWICFDADYNASALSKNFSWFGKLTYVLKNLCSGKICSVFDICDLLPFMVWAKKRFL
jgi:D-aspartate ligase